MTQSGGSQSNGSDATGSESPFTRLLDAGLYAPLGLLLTRDATVRDLAATGRKQVAFARSLGRAALAGLARSARDSSAKPAPSAAAANIPAPDYAALSAKDLIALIPQSSAAERVAIRSAETAGKARVTVLRALDAAAD